MERASIIRHLVHASVIGALALAGIAYAAAEGPSVTTAPGMQDIGRLVLTLLVVIAAFVFLTWLLRRLGGNLGSFSAGPLKIKGGLSVGPRERLVVVQVGNTHLLLGVTAETINRLHELTGEEAAQFDAPRNGEFAARLRKALGEKDKGSP